MLFTVTLLTTGHCTLPESLQKKVPLPVVISTENWPGYTNQDHSGAYFELVRLILPPTQFRLTVRFTNFSRSINDINTNKADIALAVSASDHDEILRSAWPMDQDQIVALYDPSRSKVSGLESLPSLRLAWNLAYNYGQILGINSAGYEVINTQQGIDLVGKNRVDVYLAEQGLLKRYEQQLKLMSLNWVPIASDNVYAGFSNNEKGHYLKCYWDNYVQTAYANGSLASFYKQYKDLHLAPKEQSNSN